MKLAIIIGILTFCYCGSYANVERCICLQSGAMDPQFEDHLNNFQPRPRRDESGVKFSEDPELSERKKNENAETNRPRWNVGFGAIRPMRTRSPPKSTVLRILPEYMKEESEYGIYGAYDIQG